MAKISAKFKQQNPQTNFVLNVDLELPTNGITAVYGPSGSGKTSLLRLIAGLEKTRNAFLKIGDDIWQNETIFIPTHKRPVGYVFQEASLFEHLTVDGNLSFAQRRATSGNPVSKSKITELLGIEPLLNRLPQTLSGGEKQRVAIARTLLNNPKILLMDEPLASLDTQRKQEILPFLERVRDEFNLPIIYVTHSMDEVARLADHLIMLENGQQIAQGSLAEILPNIDLAAKFGESLGAVIKAKITDYDEQWKLSCAEFETTKLWFAASTKFINNNVRLRILARDISLSLHQNHQDNSILNSLNCQIVQIEPDAHPAMKLVQIKQGNNLLLARITAKSASQLNLKVGMNIWANIKSVSVIS